MKTIRILLAGLALGALAQLPAHAFCGFYTGKVEANLLNAASQVVLVRDGKRTVLSMQNDYQGPLEDFVLVVPTPTALQKGQVRLVDKAVFERLDAYSSPRMIEIPDADPCDTQLTWGMYAHYPAPNEDSAPMSSSRVERSDKAVGVTVESRYSLGEYDIVNLSATESDGLESWLQDNGYRIPPGTGAALKPYIRQGMKFFVARVNLQAQASAGFHKLRPLQFAYESEKFMLPLRLGMLNASPDKPQDLVVYVMTLTGRVESSNYRTVKLPTDINLPFFVQPRFSVFYQDMFNRQAQQAQQHAVFTEYVWDMAWCAPCTVQPLSKSELMRAGVFWVDGRADPAFAALRAGAALPKVGEGNVKSFIDYGATTPVMLTRLHLRYSANTFPEDLLLTPTRDQKNWQAIYNIQQPYASSVAACSTQMTQLDCQDLCTGRVKDVLELGRRYTLMPAYSGKSRATLQAECVPACLASKKTALEGAARYYAQDLPSRLQSEKQTLAELTGWSMTRIESMPGANKVWGRDMSSPSSSQAALKPLGPKD